jgi:hypothetical protein
MVGVLGGCEEVESVVGIVFGLDVIAQEPPGLVPPEAATGEGVERLTAVVTAVEVLGEFGLIVVIQTILKQVAESIWVTRVASSFHEI